MPFGLCNAPAAFQRLMEQVLRGLNPEDGPDFVFAYMDDVLIYSETLEEYLQHLSLVLKTVTKAGLKLKLSKCKFLRQEVEYLGHIITRDGLKPNPSHVAAVAEYPTPQSVKDVQQFVGLASYYRRFIPNFAKVACPLHALTRKGEQIQWTPECQESFTTLKEKLTSAPVLAYPDFDKDFVLKTDASVRGLGAVLSQKQGDARYHPIAYASQINPFFLEEELRNHQVGNIGSCVGLYSLASLPVRAQRNCVHRPRRSKGNPGDPKSEWETCSLVEQGLWIRSEIDPNHLPTWEGQRQRRCPIP